MNIGIDIDGTLTVPDFWIETMNKYFNKDIKYNEVKAYDWLDIYDINFEEFDKFYKAYGPKMHFEAKLREGVNEVISNWSNHYSLNYITARQKWLEDTTKKWLDKHNLPGSIFVLGSHNKLPVAKDLNCQIFIEDNLKVATSLASEGINVFLIDCPYNKGSSLHENIKRVYTWTEIKKEVSFLAGD